jgi:hypothetical protein
LIAAHRSHSQPKSSPDHTDIAADGYRVLRSASRMVPEPFADVGRGHAICGALAIAAAISCAKAGPWGQPSVGGPRDAAILRVVGNGLRPRAATLVHFGRPTATASSRGVDRWRVRSPMAVRFLAIGVLIGKPVRRCSTSQRGDNDFGEQPLHRTPDVLSRDARVLVACHEAMARRDRR